jgi:hypothetical protein
MTGRTDIALHEDGEPVTFPLHLRGDGAVERDASRDAVRVSELLLAEDIGGDRSACDELLDAVQAVNRGEQELVQLGWDTTEVEVRADASRLRVALPPDANAWVAVPTRELYDALLQLRALLVAKA